MPTLPTPHYLSLTEAKSYLNITSSSLDTYLGKLLELSESFFENLVGRCLIFDSSASDLVEYHDGGYEIYLGVCPIRSITSVQIVSGSEIVGTLESSSYTFDWEKLIIHSGLSMNWRSVKITYKAGFDIQGTLTPTLPVNADVKLAIVKILKSLYDPKFQETGNIKSEQIEDYSYTLDGLNKVKDSYEVQSIVSHYKKISF
jgi:hypothetical protein